MPSPSSPPRRRPQGNGKLHEAGRNIAAPSARERPGDRTERADRDRLSRSEQGPETPSRASQSSEASRPEAVMPPPQGRGYLLDLAEGGEQLLRRLSEVNSVNGELRQKLESQSREISLLEESGRAQQQLFRELEHKDQQRKAEVAKARAEAQEREAQLQKELKECREQAEREKEELLEKLQESEQRFQREEGRREPGSARSSASQVFGEPAPPQAAPGDRAELDGSRISALEMELNLVRARFARETMLRQAAEKAAREAQQSQHELRQQRSRQESELARLQRDLAQRSEQVTFGQECCQDLQLRLRQQQSQAERRLQKERGKMAAVSRLEGVLPKQMLLKALA